MNNQLTPEDVKRILGYIEYPHTPTLRTLCYDYIDLWDELANERSISDRLMERIAELEKTLSRAKELAIELQENYHVLGQSITAHLGANPFDSSPPAGGT